MKAIGWWMLLGVVAAAGAAAAYFVGSPAASEWALVVFGAVGVVLLVQGALSLDAERRRVGGIVLQGAGTVAVVIAALIRPDSAVALAAYAFGIAGVVMFAVGLLRQKPLQQG